MFTKNIKKKIFSTVNYIYINFVYSNNQRSSISDLLSDYKEDFVHYQFSTIKNNSTTPESTYILINEMRFVFLLLWSKEQNILHCKK